MACRNASNHIWWDQFHPTDAVNAILAENIWNSLHTKMCYPKSLKDVLAKRRRPNDPNWENLIHLFKSFVRHLLIRIWRDWKCRPVWLVSFCYSFSTFCSFSFQISAVSDVFYVWSQHKTRKCSCNVPAINIKVWSVLLSEKKRKEKKRKSYEDKMGITSNTELSCSSIRMDFDRLILSTLPYQSFRLFLNQLPQTSVKLQSTMSINCIIRLAKVGEGVRVGALRFETWERFRFSVRNEGHRSYTGKINDKLR